jgi:hypothetical protein
MGPSGAQLAVPTGRRILASMMAKTRHRQAKAVDARLECDRRGGRFESEALGVEAGVWLVVSRRVARHRDADGRRVWRQLCGFGHGVRATLDWQDSEPLIVDVSSGATHVLNAARRGTFSQRLTSRTGTIRRSH